MSEHDVSDFLHPEYAVMRATKAHVVDLERQLAEARERGITLYRMVESRLGWDTEGYQLAYCGYPTCTGGSQGETQELLDEAEGKIEVALKWTDDYLNDITRSITELRIILGESK